jgi:hypothetical protein
MVDLGKEMKAVSKRVLSLLLFDSHATLQREREGVIAYLEEVYDLRAGEWIHANLKVCKAD